MTKKEMPNSPRPTTADGLAERAYLVRDRVVEGKDVKIWGRDMTYDEAWRLKEQIVGQRKSTTARVEHQGKYQPGANKNEAWSSMQLAEIQQRSLSAASGAAKAAAMRASQAAAVQLPQPTPPAIELANVADLAEEFGEDEDELDALIDDANEEVAQ